MENVVQVLICLPLTEDTLIMKCARLIVQLLDKNAANIPIPLFRGGVRYAIDFIKHHKFVGICDALRLMQALIKNYFRNDNVSVGEESSELYQSTELLVSLINDPDTMKKSTSCHYDGYSAIEIKSSAVFCLETILTYYEKLPDISQGLEEPITTAMLKLMYSVRLEEVSERNYCNVMRAALNSCRFIGFSNREWCTEHIGDILGACLSNMLFGLPDYTYQPPQRIQSSQQTIQDAAASSSAKKGGKNVKSRKPRQTPQHKNRKLGKTTDATNKNGDIDMNDPYAHSTLFENPSEKFEINHLTTSDSDASDPENARTGHNNREKEAKLRLAAISLIAIVAKVISTMFFVRFFTFFHVQF